MSLRTNRWFTRGLIIFLSTVSLLSREITLDSKEFSAHASVKHLKTQVFKDLSGANTKISGYTTKVSVLAGEEVNFKIHAPNPWAIEIYREGFYKGKNRDGKLIYHIGPLTRVIQPKFNFSQGTRTVDASNWRQTLSISTRGWKPGLYIARLKMGNDFGYVPFVIRSKNLRNKTVYIASFQTMQAYNNWGGYSAYKGQGESEPTSGNRAHRVTFDRPYGAGSLKHFIDNELGIAQTVDRFGKNVAWVSDYDISQGVADVTKARLLVSSAHDEYWTVQNRKAYDRAIKNGTNLMNMGGNASYWRIRYKDDNGRLARSFYIYKYDKDPIEDSSPEQSTKLWRAEPGASPESLLTAAMYNHSASYCGATNDYKAKMIESTWFGFAGTSVANNQIVPSIATHEMDQIIPRSSIPAKTQILMHSKFTCISTDGVRRNQSYDMTYYTTQTNAAVFSTGTVAWGCLLTRLCAPKRGYRQESVKFAKAVTKNLLKALSAKDAALQFPAAYNVDVIYPNIKINLIQK